jgi:uncharacterized protein (DUF608 family)
MRDLGTGEVSDDALNTLTRTQKGIPLGGIGAGNFMYNLCGSFGPWQMKTGRYEERFLSQGAFHVWEKVEGKDATARTLATHDVLPAWARLKPAEGGYYALFPRGWCIYEPFETNISLQFFSPVIKDNYRETSLPVGLFLFKIHNPLQSVAKVSVMFTFPNAPYTGPQNTPFQSALAMRERRGLINSVAQVPDKEITAILMRAHDPSNPPETENSEWCIATLGAASYLTAWDGSGDGSDVWKDFSTDGRLANEALSPAGPLPSGALSTHVELAPGSEVTVPFALAWYFPQVEFGGGTRWWRRYTEYYPPKRGQAFEIAKEALLNWDRWLKSVEAWQNPIIKDPAIPQWLKQGVLNELYYATFGGSFWENGCITKPKQFGNRPGQHLSCVIESQSDLSLEPLDVRHFPSRSNRDLWPQIERDILLVYSDFIMDTPDGSAPADVGAPGGDPFFYYDNYSITYNNTPMAADHTIPGVKGRRTVPWGEYSPKFIQQCHAYWHKTGDNTFLDEVWPALVRTFHYQKTTDTDGDGLSEMKSDEYKDNKLFNAVLWLGALEALKAMAEFKKEKAILDEVIADLSKARNSTEQQFWNEQLGYYQYNAQKPDFMGDAMIGERYVDVTGLRPVLDPKRITSHYRQLFKRAVLPLKDCNGDGIGDMGVANLLHPDGTPAIGDDDFDYHVYRAWTGVSYAAAANLYSWGKRIGDGALQATALLIAWSVYYQTWASEQTAYWFSTPESWRIDDPKQFTQLMYQRPRSIWELVMEIGDPSCMQQA